MSSASLNRLSPLARYERYIIIGFLFITVFLLSFSFRQREIGDTNIDFQNGFKLFAWIAIIIFSFRYTCEIGKSIRSVAGYSLLSLTILALFSTFWSDVKPYTCASALGFAAYLGLAALTIRRFADEVFYRLILLFLFLFIIIGLIGSVLLPDLTWQEPSVEETMFRLQGFAANANNYGRICAIAVLLSVGLMQEKSISRLAGSLTAFCGLLGLGLSGCRTSFAAMMFIGLFVFSREYKLLQLIYWLFALFLASAIIFFAYGFDINALFKFVSRTGIETEISSLTGRTEIWSSALELIYQHPLLGWGFNGTEDRLAQSMDENFYGSPVNAHQMVLQLLLGLGVLGSLPFLTALASRFRYSLYYPNLLRDLVAGFIFLNGFVEADLFATPLLTNILIFRIFLTDHLLSQESSHDNS